MRRPLRRSSPVLSRRPFGRLAFTRLALSALLVVTSLSVLTTPTAAQASIKSRARQMSNQAAKFFAQRKFKRAAELFEQAYALDSAKLIRLRNAGRAYEEAKLDRLALHCFERYLSRVKSVKLKTDAQRRTKRLRAAIAAKSRPAAVAVAKPAAGSSVIATAATAAATSKAKLPIAVATSVPKRTMAAPLGLIIGGVAGLLGGGTLVYLAGSAADDRDAAETRGDYRYPGGSAKLKSDDSAISTNRMVGWGLIGVGVLGAGVGAWLALPAKSATRTAFVPTLVPAGPGDGPGVTACFRF